MDTDDRLLDPEFRLMVLEDAKALGARAAAVKHGVSHMTIYRWRKRLGRRPPSNMKLELLEPSRPGRRRMAFNNAQWQTRWYAVEMPWLTLGMLRKHASDRIGHQISDSVVRKYLMDIGSKPEDRAFSFHESYNPDAEIIEIWEKIQERYVTIDWPEKARRRPGGVLLDALLRISVPRRPSLFVEIAADWLTGRVWLTTHLQEPYRTKCRSLNMAVEDLKKAGFRPDLVVSTWPKRSIYHPITREIIINDVDSIEFKKVGLTRSSSQSDRGISWHYLNNGSGYALAPLSSNCPNFPIDIESISILFEKHVKDLEESFKIWLPSFDRSIEKEINTTALWPRMYFDPDLTPIKFWDACIDHLDQRWPKSRRKSVRS